MTKGKLKERDAYAYTMIKDIFKPYTGQSRRFETNDYIVRLDIISLLWTSGRISDKEYTMYSDHLHRADSAADARYFKSL